MAAPRILPVTAPVESLSPLWLTEAIIALSKLSKYANEQYTAMATVSSATHPPTQFLLNGSHVISRDVRP